MVGAQNPAGEMKVRRGSISQEALTVELSLDRRRASFSVGRKHGNQGVAEDE